MLFVAIGGINPQSSIHDIEKEIVRLTGKSRPRLLYLPTAGSDDLRNLKFVKEGFEALECKVEALCLVNQELSKEEVHKKIIEADILYFGGGRPKVLMDTLESYDLVTLLYELQKSGTVVAGTSAGALWVGHDYIRVEKNGYQTKETALKCAGYLNTVITPHYNHKDPFHGMDTMTSKRYSTGLGIPNNCAVVFVGDDFKVIGENTEDHVYIINNDFYDLKRSKLEKNTVYKIKTYFEES